VSAGSVAPGEMIDLELTALANISFMGFILQARELDNKDRQVRLADERIDKHILAQTDRQVCRRDEFTVWWGSYDRNGIRAYCTGQVGTKCLRGQTGVRSTYVQ
jgi:hypothetical protein